MEYPNISSNFLFVWLSTEFVYFLNEGSSWENDSLRFSLVAKFPIKENEN